MLVYVCMHAHGNIPICSAVIWTLHDIAITNIVWCIAYKRGVGGASYIAQ